MNRRHCLVALWAAFFVVTALALPTQAAKNCRQDGVTVSYRQDGDCQCVVGTIRIHQPPSRVWPILANPYEFEENISPRFKTVAVLADQPHESRLRCRVDLGFILPSINYVVESKYEPQHRITFQSTAGDLKTFRGSWEVTPVLGGLECDVTYCLFMVPGIPLPQFIVRQAVKFELPHTLIGLRLRVEDVCGNVKSKPVHRTLAAANAGARG